MKKNIIILIVILLVIAFFYISQLDKKEPIVCIEETKICSDGSVVGRTGPNCEFAECPLNNNKLLSNFGNDQIERAITNYLLTQKLFSWKTKDDSHNFCVIENLKPDNELFPLYVWACCGEYIIQDGELKELSGSSGPKKINYPNELSFYDLSKFSYEAPGDGSHYPEDIRKIFPEDVQQRIFNFDRENIIKRIENIAFTNILSWELIKEAVNNCEVKKVFQTHRLLVTVNLKNGEELTATEPKIDDIMKIVKEAEPKCGNILMGTE